MHAHKAIGKGPSEGLGKGQDPQEGFGDIGKGFGKDFGKGLGKSDWDLWHKLPDDLPDTSLGVLKTMKHPDYEALEWLYKKRLQALATTHWPVIQEESSEEALALWQEIWVLLELDAESWMDLMLLVHQSPVGRSEANKVLFELLTRHACTSMHKNLSRKVSTLIKDSRRAIDRPPDGHRDLEGWSWRKALVPRFPEFLQEAVPKDARVTTGPGGVPRAPLGCFVPPGPPVGPPPPAGPPPGASGASSSSGGPPPPPPPPRGRLQWQR